MGNSERNFFCHIFQNPAKNWFTVTIVVRICGIYVCHAGINGSVKYFLLLIHR